MIKKTELYIENRQLDLYGDDAFLLNFNVADISDITAKASSYSKEVDIPATKENNKTFSHLFDVSSEGYFNPISKKTSEVYVDGVCVMRGFFKLNSITIIDNEYVTYHGVIYEDSVNFVQTLGDLQLSNLVLPLTSTFGPPSPTLPPQNIEFTSFDSSSFQTFFGNILGIGTNIPIQRKYNLNFNTFTNPSNILGVFGTLQDIPKGDISPWQGTNHFPTVIKAFRASQPCVLNVTAQVALLGSRNIQRGFVKAVQNNAGVWVHAPVQGLTSSTLPNGLHSQTATINLQVGEAFYYFFTDTSPLNYTFTIIPPSIQPPLPINISTSATRIIGTVQSTTPPGPTNPLLINETFVGNNMSVAVNSDNADICFPVIDYNQSYPYSASNKKLDQINEAEKPAVRVEYEDLRPGVFVKKVWDAIFKQSGFKYRSKFLDTNADLFKKLIVVGGMDDDEVEAIQYESVLTGNTATYLVTENATTVVQDVETAPGTSSYIYDYRALLWGGKVPGVNPNNYWNKKLNRTSYTENLKVRYTDANRTNAAHGFSGVEYGDVLKALVGGKYKIQAQIDATSLAVFYGGVNAPVSKQGIIYRFKIETIKGGSFNNDPVLFQAPAKSKWTELKVLSFTRAENVDNQDFKLTFDETIELEQGDLARVVLYASAEAQNDPNGTDATAYASRTNLKLNGSCYVKYYRLGTWMGYSATSITNMLPRAMKQSDFIMSIAKMFNLYFEPDKQDPRTIYIEPRDTYYEDGRVLNWEKKLDYSKPLDITILPHDQAKNFVFKYEDDGDDYLTENFKKFNANNLTFGSYDFVSPDEYVSDTTELSPKFVSSYLQKISGTDPLPGYTGPLANPMVITKIISPDSQKPGYEGTPSSWKKEPRILIYGGAIQLPPIQNRNYRFLLLTRDAAGDVFEYDFGFYTYAGHFDRPVQPTVDINFFTDTSYLPTTYWQNSVGNASVPSASTTTINIDGLVIGQQFGLTYTGSNYFTPNASVDKYVRISSTVDPNNYLVGVIINASPSTLILKVTEKFGTGTLSSWKIQLVDVLMKNNLFNVFYKQQMIELTDQSSRLMTCNINLTPTDIANFRFNDIVYAHKEYWRVNKIVDYDTSSDVNQTTQVELIKILRANTSPLIDYIQGGYLGINGATGGSTTTTGTGTINGNTPSVVAMGPAGTPGVYNRASFDQLMTVRNSIIRNGDGVSPTYFNKEAEVYINSQDLTDSVVRMGNDLNIVRELGNVKPVGEAITYVDGDAGVITLPTRFTQVYYDVVERDKLFIMNLEPTTTDGYLIHFDALNDTTTTFMQIANPNATTNEVFVLNEDNSVTAKYDAIKDIWVISRA
jgi:hypothetical protein